MSEHMEALRERALPQMTAHLAGLAEFWRTRARDPEGGFRSTFDPDGRPVPETVKSLIAQTRILWSCSALARATGDAAFADLAHHGMDYLATRFWDEANGGWHWLVGLDGRPVDRAKLMYGQSFGLYATCAYAQVFGDHRARELAEATFAAMHKAVDAAHGGFFENLDPAWEPEATASGRRKSLDIHLHLMESFTALARLTGSPVHRRRLGQVRDLILGRMLDPSGNTGGNQFTADFEPLRPIVIDRTWIAERHGDGGASVPAPAGMTASYGHDLELGWLLGQADQLLDGDVRAHAGLVDRLAGNTLEFGYDHAAGGVYREGPPGAPASDTDKEFWQNAEALVGFLHAHQVTGREDYLAAFAKTWDFARAHLIHPDLGEWRTRTTASGQIADAALGNQWTGAYHTVRAALESVARLEAILAAGAPETR
jgi:mannobiose 2-epimerase